MTTTNNGSRASRAALNAHKRNTNLAHNPDNTHWVAIDTWDFDQLEHGFETKAKALVFADEKNRESGVALRWTIKERKGAF